MNPFHRQHLCLVIVLLVTRLVAQLPDMHHHMLVPSNGTLLAGVKLGSQVAVDGNLVLIQSPHEPDPAAGGALGVVRVYHFASGLLLGKLARPPGPLSSFGDAVAISGNRVAVSSEDVGKVYVYDLGGATPLQPVLAISVISSYDKFGAAVALSGDLLVVGEPRKDVGAAYNAGMAYVYDLASATPTVPLFTLPNPAPRDYAAFGQEVAISGSRVIIGAPDDDLGPSSSAGSAYAYDLASATPTSATTLTNPAISSDDKFGSAVSISGAMAVVGAPGNTLSGFSRAGSAYLYNLASGAPGTAVQVFDNPAPATQENFASSLCISGTGIAVGIPADDVGLAVDTGRVVIYDLTSATPSTPVAFFSSPSPATSDRFGQCVAASGVRVVVGAPEHDLSAPNGGAAWFYDLGSSTPLVPVATVSETAPQSQEFFGAHIAISGNRVVVGAPLDDTGAENAGKVYVFDLSSATPLVPVLTLNNPTPASYEQFGYRVAVDGARVAVTCFGDIPTTAARNGKIYIYDLNGPTPSTPVTELGNSALSYSWDEYGASLALTGDRVIVGSPGYEPFRSGRVYIFDLGSATPATPTLTLTNPGLSGAAFGWSVSISGDSLLVGAPDDNTGAYQAGRAYLYDLDGPSPGSPVHTVNNPSPNSSSDRFGWAVSLSGSGGVVSALYDGGSGSVHVYNFAGGTPTTPVATLTSPNPGTDYNFGHSVSAVGTQVVIGTPGADLLSPLRSSAGRAYLFDLASLTPLTPLVTYTHPSPEEYDQFASSIAFDGTHAVFGSPSDNVLGLPYRGSVQVFGPDPTWPEIVVEQPSGTGLTDGSSSVDFGIVGAGETGQPRTFTIRNTGTAELNISSINVLGGNPLNFQVTAPALPAQIAVGGSTTFTVQFAPNAAGARATTLYIVSDDLDEAVFDIALSGDGYTIVIGGPDPNFHFDLPATIHAIAPLPDGKTLVGGSIPTPANIVRLNEDGSVDTAFNCTPNGIVHAIVTNPDGTSLIAGNFTLVNGTPRDHMARLLANGALDPSFNADFNDQVFSIAVQPDGKMLVCGEFTSVGGTGRNFVARLNPDGSLDASFDASITFGASVQCVALQPDGKILIGGPFFQIHGVFQRWFRRLNADGTLDAAFSPTLDQGVQSLVVQPDGRIVIGGVFTNINGTPRQRLARLNADGTLDTSFVTDTNQPVYSLAAQADGRVIIGGFFTIMNGVTRNHMARLNADGTLDTTFNPDVDNLVYAVALRADGEVFVGGFFSNVSGQAHANLARLDNNAATGLLAVPDTSRVVWLRGGASPEAHEVMFEVSSDGGAMWSSLGAATRINNGWQRTGLALPASARIRARARTAGAEFGGSAGIAESVLDYANAPAPVGDLRIGSTSYSGGLFILNFTSTPGLTGWNMRGSIDLNGFPLDLTSVTQFQELTPGSYRATVTVPGSPQRLFLRVER